MHFKCTPILLCHIKSLPLNCSLYTCSSSAFRRFPFVDVFMLSLHGRTSMCRRQSASINNSTATVRVIFSPDNSKTCMFACNLGSNVQTFASFHWRGQQPSLFRFPLILTLSRPRGSALRSRWSQKFRIMKRVEWAKTGNDFNGLWHHNLRSVHLLLGVGGSASPTMLSDSAGNKPSSYDYWHKGSDFV